MARGDEALRPRLGWHGRLMRRALPWALRGALAVTLAATAASCDRAPPEQPLRYARAPASPQLPTYLFAVHPLHNPQMLAATYQPLVDRLNRRLSGARIELVAARDYATYNARFRARGPAILLPNPWQTLEAIKVGYRVIAMAGRAEDFRGVFIARRDSPIRQVSDLKGKVVSYPAPTALAACMMPQRYLHERGLDVNRDIVNAYVGSQESSILQAYLGKAAVAATWPPPWRLFQHSHPREAAELKVLWQTEHLLNNSVMVRDDVPPAIAAALREALLQLADDAEGQAILAGLETQAFYPADDASYAPVRAYIAAFERDVRAVEGP